MQVNPTRYRMRYTGKELDEILTSVKYKIDENSIANDFNGGFTRVASAELARILNENINSLKDPNSLLNLIKEIPGIEFLSDELKAKIEYMSDKFRGVYEDHADRDANVPTTNLTGNEIILVMNAGLGLAAWEYWDSIVRTWTPVKFYDTGEELPVSVSSPSPTAVITVDTTKYSCVKAVVTALKATESQASEIMVTISPTKEVNYSVGNVTGSNTRLFTLDCAMSGDNLIINIIASSGTHVKAHRITTF